MVVTEEPIRVAHVMGKMVAGGVQSVVMNYYRHIDRSKVQFDFLIDEDSPARSYAEIERLGGRVYKIPPYQKPASYHRALVRLLKQNKYRIVHSHINTLSVFSLFAAKRAGVPVRIAHSHSAAGKGETGRNIMKYALRPFSRVFSTHYCACSEYAGRWLFGDKALKSGKVFVVKNAIQLSRFRFDPRLRESVRAELGLEGKLVVGHVGRFVKTKNHTFLIEIFHQVYTKNPDAMLLLVGEGEREREIREKVRRLKLEGSVCFLGLRNDIYRLLQAVDIFVLPSLYEGLGMAAIEAQACGLPVIASNRVPKEARIMSGFDYASLKQDASEWAKLIADCASPDRSSETQRMSDAGYDIDKATGYLCTYYLNL